MNPNQNPFLRRALERHREGNDAPLVKLVTSKDRRIALKAMVELLRELSNHPEVAKVDSCSAHRRCHSRLCPHCAIPPKGRQKYQQEAIHQVRLGKAKSRSHDPQVRAAQQVQGFYRFTQDEVFFVTLNLEATAGWNLADAISRWRKKLRYRLGRMAPALTVRGKFEFDLTVPEKLPEAHLIDASSVRALEPSIPVYKLHLHVLTHAPGFTPRELKERLLAAFECQDREVAIDVRNLRDKHTREGINIQGLEGVARYYAKEVTDFSGIPSQPLPSYAAIMEEILALPRRSLNFEWNRNGKTSEASRRKGRWLQAVRYAEGLDKSASEEDVEAYLLEHDIDQLVYQVMPEDMDSFRCHILKDFLHNDI